MTGATTFVGTAWMAVTTGRAIGATATTTGFTAAVTTGTMAGRVDKEGSTAVIGRVG